MEQAQQANKQQAQAPLGNCGTCANSVGGQSALHAQLLRGKLDVAHASRMREVHRNALLLYGNIKPLWEN